MRSPARRPFLPARLLWRHEGGRPDDHAADRGTCAGAGFDEHRNAEIEKLELPARRAEHVRGFDVAMDDAHVVRSLEDLEQAEHDVECFAHGQRGRTTVGVTLERRAVKSFHHQERAAVVGATIVDDAYRAVVRDLVRDVALAQEAANQ